MGLKSKRRRAHTVHRQAKKVRQATKDKDDDVELRNLISDSESSDDHSDDYFKEKDELPDNVEEILPITNEDDSDDEETDDEDDNKYDEYDNADAATASPPESSASEDEDTGPIEAWGKKRKTFYSTDFVDEDRGKSYREEDLENAKAEENDALAIHKNFLSDIYTSSSYITPESEFAVANELGTDQLELARPDWKSIDKKDKLHLIQKQNPEFLPIVHCFKEKLSELKNRIFPLLRILKTVDVSVAEPYIEYINLKSQLLLHYCMNASFYMTLRSLNTPSSRHPVVKRLNDFKNLLDRFKALDVALNPGIDEILKSAKKQSAFTQSLFSKVFNQANREKSRNEAPEQMSSNSIVKTKTAEGTKTKKKVHFDTEAEKGILVNPVERKEKQQQMEASDDSQESSDEEQASSSEDNTKPHESEENSKRMVSYEIVKNKGLTKQRKKEYRNPRVRHRVKFKKAQIRRKGQVRIPRKELKKYGGEMSGISSHVSKSIKIK